MTSKRDLMRKLKEEFDEDAHQSRDEAEKSDGVTAARYEGQAAAYESAAMRLGEALAGRS